jgi:hypothetical protein
LCLVSNIHFPYITFEKLIIVKNWQIVKKNEIKKLENELKYLEEPSNTSTYKEDTSIKHNGFTVFLVF